MFVGMGVCVDVCACGWMCVYVQYIICIIINVS